MNPPEKYIFNEKKLPFYYMFVDMVVSTKPIEAVGRAYPTPTIKFQKPISKINFKNKVQK
jgi:hypothetical protein